MQISKEKINSLFRRMCDDNEAFTAFYEAMERPMFAVAYRILQSREEAEDVVHDSFLKLYKKETTERVSQGYSYALSTVRNEALQRLRKSKREFPCGEVRAATLLNPVKSVIEDALRELTQEERVIVTLRVNAELGYREIGKVVGLSAATVFRRYMKAISKIRKELET
ncbi:MAG: sigma-70 family RNA polymerase sigma factor [Lachnospiraceae bacterium]|nr:sigma-70 family RNA polymerase sigma factor [Lachnospiraceae bacterium]